MLRMNGSAVFLLHRSELEGCVTQQADMVVKVPTGQHWRTGKVFNLKKKKKVGSFLLDMVLCNMKGLDLR